MSKWEWKEFEDCIEHVKYTTKIPSKDYLQEGEFPIVSQEDCLISGYWNDKNDLFKVTKPIVIFGDHTKVLKYIDFDFVLGADGVKILCPRDFLDAHFFFYFLKSVNFDNLGYARHYRLLKELSVPIPSLLEQKRIVKRLDEEFSKIDTLKTNAETNLKNAKELFETTLEKELNPEKNGTLPSAWEWKKFEDCIEHVKYTTKIPSKDYLREGEFPIVSQEDCLISGYWNEKNDLFKVTKPIVIFGDHTKVLKYIDFDFVLGADGVKILCPKDFLNARFFFFFLKSVNFDNLGYARHYRLLKELSVSIPPLSVQKEIVARLDKLSENVKRLEVNYKQIITDCDELKKSILKKTFERES